MDKLFNTVFENSLRILILLDVFQKPQNMDMIRTSAIKVISVVGQKNERELIAEINRLSKNMN